MKENDNVTMIWFWVGFVYLSMYLVCVYQAFIMDTMLYMSYVCYVRWVCFPSSFMYIYLFVSFIISSLF